MGLSAALLIGSVVMFLRAGTGVRPFTEATTLLERGPFRFTRNPIYLGMLGMSPAHH